MHYIEEWRDAPGYEDMYLVSSLGRFYSKERLNVRGSRLKAKFLALSLSSNGYLLFFAYKNTVCKSFLAHRFVMKTFCGEFYENIEVDHIDGDKFNNKISNLRMVTKKDNQRAHKKTKDNASSKYRGVYRIKTRNKWQSKIGFDGVSIYLGSFSSEIEAAKAYNAKAIQLGFFPEALNKI